MFEIAGRTVLREVGMRPSFVVDCLDAMHRTGKLRVLSSIQIAGLFILFFCISFGLGYPILNRYDPREIEGLSDVRAYAALVTGQPVLGPDHMRYRVLIPYIARPFYDSAKGRVGTWNPLNFGLLVADSIFVAGTAVLIIVIGTNLLGSYPVSLVAALLYMVNFCVPNTRLVGSVDAGEGFFLLGLFWSLSLRRWWMLLATCVLGALTKESFIPFSFVFLTVWFIVQRRVVEFPARKAFWIIVSWLTGLLALVAVQWRIRGNFINPVQFGISLHQNHEYLRHFAHSFLDHSSWFIFFWLLPLGIPRLSAIPRSWLLPTAAMAVMAFVLDCYYGSSSGTVARALFSITGPILALTSATLLLDSSC